MFKTLLWYLIRFAARTSRISSPGAMIPCAVAIIARILGWMTWFEVCAILGCACCLYSVLAMALVEVCRPHAEKLRPKRGRR